MPGEQEAIHIRPPAGYGSGSTYAVLKVAFTGTSSAAEVTPANGLDIAGCWVTFKADQACYFRVGNSAVGAATSDDWELAAGEEKSYFCSKNDGTHVRVIRKSADGTLKMYRSG